MEYIESFYTEDLLAWIDGVIPADWVSSESVNINEEYDEDDLPF